MDNRKHRKPVGILVKMGWIYAVTIGLMVLISGVAVYHYVYTDMETMTEESINLKLDTTVRLLNNVLDDVDRAMQTAIGSNGTMLKTTDAASSPLYRLVSDYEEVSFGDTKTVAAVKGLEDLNDTLKSVFAKGVGIENADYRIRIYLDDRYAVSRYMSYGEDVRENGIYKAVMTDENPIFDILSKAGGRRKFFHDVNHLDKEPAGVGLYEGMLLKCNVVKNEWQVSKECLGYAVCEFRAGLIEEILKGKEYQNVSSYILDEDGKVWASHIGYIELEESRLQEIVKNVRQGIQVGGKEHFVKQSTLTNGMQIIMVMPRSVIENQVMGNVIILFLAFLFLLTVYVGVLLYMNRQLIHPVVGLARYMEKGELEELQDKRSVNESKEMQILYHSFNQFIRQSKQYIENIYRMEKEKREMEYSMLQAQINPHFLYNTLDSIGCLSLLSGLPEVADLLRSLARIMRYSIHDMNSLVPLKEEIDISREYVKIQYSCHRGGLEVFYNIEEGLQEVLVPKLIVQPLVENAISHGMNLSDGKGVLEIGTEKEDGFVFITVWDNGSKLDMGKIENYLTGKMKSDVKGGGLGIYNIAQRLQNQYGDRAALFFRQDENGCTEAVIRIPL